MPGTALAHDAFVYGSDDEFTAWAVPFLTEAVEAGEGAVAVTHAGNAELLRHGLGEVAAEVRFIDSARHYRRAVDTIADYDQVVRGYAARGTPLRVLGEVEFGLTPEQHLEWTRYEAVLNRVFEDARAWIVCPYDRRALPPEIVEDAARTHPHLCEAGRRLPSADYVAPERFVAGRTLPLPGTGGIPTRVLDVDASNLDTARHALAGLARGRAVEGDRMAGLVAGLNELVTNAIVHGGGRAMVRLWSGPRHLTCEVTDHGPGLPDPLAGFRPPDPGATGGRGLWMARQLFDRLELLPAKPSGLTVRASARI